MTLWKKISIYKNIYLQSRQACETFGLQSERVENGVFAVDIIVRRPLDFESVRSYVLAVKAVNREAPANLTTKNFVINVLDSQDQLPVFLRGPYSPIPMEEIAVVRDRPTRY